VFQGGIAGLARTAGSRVFGHGGRRRSEGEEAGGRSDDWRRRAKAEEEERHSMRCRGVCEDGEERRL
jgi:hypothetical protein